MRLKMKYGADGKTGGVFAAAFFLSFLFAVHCFASPLLDRVVAVVNKEVITWSELYRAMEFEASGAMKALSDEERKKVFKENEASFLESMIDKKLQLQFARSLDIGAAKEEIDETINGIKKKYAMSDKDFQESLKKEGFTYDEYRKRLSEQIILNKLVGQQVRNRIVVTEEEVNDYIAKNSSGEYKVRQIFFRKPEKENDRKTVEAKAEEILQRLKNGDDFASLAFRYSEDSSAKTGGELGFIRKEDLGKEFLDALSGMSEGDVSRPFWTARGLHIVKLEEKVGGKDVSEFRESVKKKLFDKRFEQNYRSWVRGLREKAFVEVRL
ncbi:MAG: peptidylprolyl isomerase [Nitrospirae bacterium]|nr:peptidylprolyl isomerase [Nitrospirota bacterium]